MAYWGSWEDYPKTYRKGEQVAIIDGRYYTKHAVDHFTPSYLDSYDGRGISPTYIEEAIRYGSVVERRSNSVTYQNGSLLVAIDPDDGTVITVMDRHK